MSEGRSCHEKALWRTGRPGLALEGLGLGLGRADPTHTEVRAQGDGSSAEGLRGCAAEAPVQSRASGISSGVVLTLAV